MSDYIRAIKTPFGTWEIHAQNCLCGRCDKFSPPFPWGPHDHWNKYASERERLIALLLGFVGIPNGGEQDDYYRDADRRVDEFLAARSRNEPALVLEEALKIAEDIAYEMRQTRAADITSPAGLLLDQLLAVLRSQEPAPDPTRVPHNTANVVFTQPPQPAPVSGEAWRVVGSLLGWMDTAITMLGTIHDSEIAPKIVERGRVLQAEARAALEGKEGGGDVNGE